MCKQVVAGLEFNLFLLDDGEVWFSGQIGQASGMVISTEDFGNEPLINLSDVMRENNDGQAPPFASVSAGYSHAMLLDEEGKVYTFGAGDIGQLGDGPEATAFKYPLDVIELNFGSDRVKLMSAGANYCVCYTEAGILYYWGMLIPDNYESIEYLPNFLGIVLPDDASEEALFEFHLTHIATTFREVLACDSTGVVYHCNLNDSQTLKPYPASIQRMIGSAH